VLRRRKRPSQDVFERSLSDLRATEDEQPWFLGDDDVPELDVEAGRSARMDDGEDGHRH
jgi:hypothetical protein